MRWHELGLTCWVEVSGGAAGGGVRDPNPAFRPGFAPGRAALGELLQQTGDSREPAPGSSTRRHARTRDEGDERLALRERARRPRGGRRSRSPRSSRATAAQGRVVEVVPLRFRSLTCVKLQDLVGPPPDLGATPAFSPERFRYGTKKSRSRAERASYPASQT